jgi:hypothetical protein
MPFLSFNKAIDLLALQTTGVWFVINFVVISGYKIVLGSSTIDFKHMLMVILSIPIVC